MLFVVAFIRLVVIIAARSLHNEMVRRVSAARGAVQRSLAARNRAGGGGAPSPGGSSVFFTSPGAAYASVSSRTNQMADGADSGAAAAAALEVATHGLAGSVAEEGRQGGPVVDTEAVMAMEVAGGPLPDGGTAGSDAIVELH